MLLSLTLAIALGVPGETAAAGASGSARALAGRVWEDRNGNGALDRGEPGWAGVTVTARPPGERSPRARAVTDRTGAFRLEIEAGPGVLEVTPPGGSYPTTPAAVASSDETAAIRFGLARFRTLTLATARPLSLASAELAEPAGIPAEDDADLILGSEAGGTEQLSVWLNHSADLRLYSTRATYRRSAPSSVLCLATDSLAAAPGMRRERLDVVAGTSLAGEGNLFVWITPRTRGNQGFLPARPTRAYRTADAGDVVAVRTGDLAGGAGADIVVGTRSPDPGRGTVEVWVNDDGPVPGFARRAVYPSAALGPAALDEVGALELADLDGDGCADLIVGTRAADGTGALLILSGRGTPDVFARALELRLGGAVNAMVATDYDLDRRVDLVIAVQTGPAAGELQLWRNVAGADPETVLRRDTTLALPGVPTSVASADLGGASNPDLAVGYRTDGAGFAGGARVFFMDGGAAGAPVDPSAGTITGTVRALHCAELNLEPGRGGASRRPDLAAAVRTGPGTGAVVLLVR